MQEKLDAKAADFALAMAQKAQEELLMEVRAMIALLASAFACSTVLSGYLTHLSTFRNRLEGAYELMHSVFLLFVF